MNRPFSADRPVGGPLARTEHRVVQQTWRDRVVQLRDRLLQSTRFQQWAAAFPLTRPIARARARQTFDICAGFVYSQVLFACVRLQLLESLASGPRETNALAIELGVPLESMRRLLAAATALRLVELRSGDRFGLGTLGAVVAGNAAIRAMVEHHGMLYADLADPVALLRGERSDTALARYWPYARAALPGALSDEMVAGYSRLMGTSHPLVASEILAAYSLRRHARLLDVGGGEGAFLIAAAAQAPALRLMLFDLPAVVARAQVRLAQAGLGAQSVVHGGDFLRDPLPRGADVISLIRVVHDHDDDVALALLRAVREALPAGGTLLLAEPMASTPGAQRMGDAYFGLYLLAMGQGRPRSAAELGSLVRRAGFTAVRMVGTRLPLQTRLLVARRPEPRE